MKKVALVIILVGLTVFFISRRSENITGSENVSQGHFNGRIEDVFVKENGGYKEASAFNFSFSILDNWQVGAALGSRAINIYDSSIENNSALEQSQIFITFFDANDFQTLSTVNVLSRMEHTVAGRPAVTYVITKKENVADFAGQPSWRNVTHKVTDVRVSDENPSRFYVFAKNPELSEAEFQRFLSSLEF